MLKTSSRRELLLELEIKIMMMMVVIWMPERKHFICLPEGHGLRSELKKLLVCKTSQFQFPFQQHNEYIDQKPYS